MKCTICQTLAIYSIIIRDQKCDSCKKVQICIIKYKNNPFIKHFLFEKNFINMLQKNITNTLVCLNANLAKASTTIRVTDKK